ncbi:hypothetical protein [Ferruginibacter sp. HRS2-29]|uniref:hypothetical protein n=1 Tax=Ferruginibacter sp. HRS2-29 TaxID=2487334 RepID=UPI0020CD5C46|nr:hypothetical protein [Ferruginibacter sp. HRS2-29]MCP9749975.1 hypothetical protein [Ferruginibacter sp. HRS2-29]
MSISGAVDFYYYPLFNYPLSIIFAAMFRKLTATVLLMAFVAQTFSAPFIRLDYFFNQADYARNCVNKARPMLHCNGKCQVMKKIQAEEKKEQEEQERKMGSKVEVLSSRSFYATGIIVDFFEPIAKQYSSLSGKDEIQMPRSVFHPPSF